MGLLTADNPPVFLFLRGYRQFFFLTLTSDSHKVSKAFGGGLEGLAHGLDQEISNFVK